MDKINLSKLIKGKAIQQLFPVNDKLCSRPGVSYSYSPTIRSKITNYQEAVCSMDPDLICHCKEYSEFIDNHHNHVITGNLNIITNLPIQSLLRKGLNYREKSPIQKYITLTSIINSTDIYISKIYQEIKSPITAFIPWKTEIIKKVMAVINKTSTYSIKTILDNIKNKSYIKDIHSKFVLVQIDKASNNISIICKKYYVQVLKEEITNSGNFQPVNNTKESSLTDAKLYLTNINIFKKDNDNFQVLYWIPKMHKTPIEPRYITSGRNSLYSNLSKTVSTCLKSLLNTEKINSLFKHKFDNINQYYIIDSNLSIIKHMDKSNRLPLINKSVKTFDFKTLYTNISHSKLKNNTNKFIQDIFTNNNNKYIIYGYSSSHMTNNKSKSTFTDNELVTHINKIIDNAYIIYNNHLYKQVIGIPMGTNCAPHLANIFLHIYEKQYIGNIITSTTNPDILGKLKYIYRFQDDLIAFEDDNMFQNKYKEIYPSEMVLKNTNVSPNEVNYLDLYISVENNQYIYRKYDKTNDYPFTVIKYPNLSANTPVKPAYGVFISQLVRYTRINKDINGFIKDTIEIIHKLTKTKHNQD